MSLSSNGRLQMRQSRSSGPPKDGGNTVGTQMECHCGGRESSGSGSRDLSCNVYLNQMALN